MKRANSLLRVLALSAVTALLPSSTHAADAPKPLRLLLITGGCCHAYGAQKDLLKAGIEARLHAQVDQVHSSDASTKPPLAIYGHPEYGQGYDLIIHDECAADISDPTVIEGVLKPHRDGVPGVNLHCAMHSYRIGNPNEAAQPGSARAGWFDYLGLQSSGHGPQKPITLGFMDRQSPLLKGLTEWTTINEELYNNIMIWGKAKALVRGTQEAGDKPGQTDTVVAWTNTYGPKGTRVFSTTIGHNSDTVADPRYLDLVTRGILWATGHLTAEGSAAPGYAK